MGKGRVLTGDKKAPEVPEEVDKTEETPTAASAPEIVETQAPQEPEATVKEEEKPGENPGPTAEASEVVEEAVETGLDAMTDVADALADAQSRVLDVAGRLSRALEALTVSGAAGMLAIPKVGEPKAAFVKRIQGRHPSFDIAVWHRDDEALVREKFPGNFGGEGW